MDRAGCGVETRRIEGQGERKMESNSGDFGGTELQPEERAWEPRIIQGWRHLWERPRSLRRAPRPAERYRRREDRSRRALSRDLDRRERRAVRRKLDREPDGRRLHEKPSGSFRRRRIRKAHPPFRQLHREARLHVQTTPREELAREVRETWQELLSLSTMAFGCDPNG
jgi:hypothetical protein